MKRHTPFQPLRVNAFACALTLLLIYGMLYFFASGVAAAVHLLYFTATQQGESAIRLAWETGSEEGTVAFNLYRAADPGIKGEQIGDTFIQQGDPVAGAEYHFDDTQVTPGVRYYYTLDEITDTGDQVKLATAVAGIGVATLTPTATATVLPATATATATTVQSGGAATRTPTATAVSGNTSSDQPTATRQFTNTPAPATAAPEATPTPVPFVSATPVPIGSGVVSTPTAGPRPPDVPVSAAESTAVATPFPPTEPTASLESLASPSPEIFATSAVQPVLDLTPTATRPPQVFAAATSQARPGTPARPTPAPVDKATRNTNSILLLGGGAIVLAAALAGGVLLVMRSRRQ